MEPSEISQVEEPSQQNSDESSEESTSALTTLSSVSSIDFGWLIKKDEEVKPFDLETFLDELDFDPQSDLPDAKVERVVGAMDSLEMLQALQELSNELCSISLEKIVLIDFLEKHDPKVLQALRQRRPTSDSGHSQGSSVSIHTTYSLASASSGKRPSIRGKSPIQYYVRHETKTELAEKASLTIEKRIKENQVEAMRYIKQVAAELEEINLSITEAEKTMSNFELHFLLDSKDVQFLKKATEQELDRKFRKFVTNWLKDARVIIATLRMLVPSVQEKSRTAEGTLLTKSDMAKLLGPVDFQGMIIKRTQLLRVIDEKNAHLYGLKGVTGKASIAMGAEKQKLVLLEAKCQRTHDKTVEVVRSIGKLEAELELVREKNDETEQTLRDLKTTLENYQAPSVNEYVEVKDETTNLEREEKMLVRKINIMNMKLAHLQTKFKRIRMK